MRATALTLLLALTLVSGCNSKLPSVVPPTLPLSGGQARVGGVLTADEVLALFSQQFGNPSLLLVDVRMDDEFSAEHIPGAANITYDLSDQARDRRLENAFANVPRSINVVFYSNMGVRSGEARRVLAGIGFSGAWDMADGLDVWKARGYPTIN